MGQTSGKKVEGKRSSSSGNVDFIDRPLCYIAGPMTSAGNPYTNIRRAIILGEYVRKLGWAVIVPHLDALTTMVTGIESAAHYLDNDFNMLSRCDAVCMIPYGSDPTCGTAQELDVAEELGIPVFTQDTLPTAYNFLVYTDEWENCPKCGVRL